MKKEIKVISSFLIIFLFLTLNAHADFRFQVRIVQFQPTDAPAEKVDIVEIAKGAQEFTEVKCNDTVMVRKLSESRNSLGRLECIPSTESTL